MNDNVYFSKLTKLIAEFALTSVKEYVDHDPKKLGSWNSYAYDTIRTVYEPTRIHSDNKIIPTLSVVDDSNIKFLIEQLWLGNTRGRKISLLLCPSIMPDEYAIRYCRALAHELRHCYQKNTNMDVEHYGKRGPTKSQEEYDDYRSKSAETDARDFAEGYERYAIMGLQCYGGGRCINVIKTITKMTYCMYISGMVYGAECVMSRDNEDELSYNKLFEQLVELIKEQTNDK